MQNVLTNYFKAKGPKASFLMGNKQNKGRA